VLCSDRAVETGPASGRPEAMIDRGLIEARSGIVWAAVALVIAYGALLTRVRKTRISLSVIEISTGLALAALVGYPLVLATAYAASFVERWAGTWVAVGLYLFGALLAASFTVILFVNFVMSAGTFGRAFTLGAAGVIAAMLVTGVWAISGGNAARVLSWKVPEALLLVTTILALWRAVREIPRTSWAGTAVKMRIVYVGLVALFALSVSAGVQFILSGLSH
jgi:hypothetical protein